MSSTIDLCCELISRPSVSPDDQGCQDVLSARLQKLGFQLENMPFGEVKNLWARRGTTAPLFCFAGHTDVVPASNPENWDSEPFSPEIRDGLLYGRGSADMKGSLAAMITACENFLAQHAEFNGSIAFLITSDEESIAVDGTVKVIETLQNRNEQIDYCLVGEPSSSKVLGDTVRNGRRGSLNGNLKVIGKEGHVAYPDLAINPIHTFLPALTELSQIEWDQGNDYFPATSFQISNISAGQGTTNVIPGEMSLLFNFRFSTEVTAEGLMAQVQAIFDHHYENYELEWQLSGNPFITEEGVLTNAVVKSIEAVNGVACSLSTGGGTSDGRFIAPSGAQVVELGPINASIHKNNEHVAVADLDQLALMYEKILEEVLL
ncbi:MAG: succinyl-diaminopimelate desuccinylase [SAR86 cluster bacterium]|uniref:Succinyl-diaminopimelate desuccinylase n=1 Tax=SAR86 cluster bacterium TaxID=2030880 RepID=A0A2A5CA66_9GAMM|nr:succinyl-diaminopimelate desuccinylase [Gammaproteobacteria bacterium AH-315-E17]PCJ40381.1 MAG: succinyl-diaminopimelate desuccinylase [SAR86 cluster bacterium]